MTVAVSKPTTSTVIEPCRDVNQLRAYIDEHWRKGHILSRDPRMFDFTYRTPFVDRSIWPLGTSTLGIYERDRLLGFLGAIVANYPRPQSYWLALWHVLPELKGGGAGGRLLQRMQDIALSQGGWIGTFGAGPEALPVYLKRGYCCRAVRRWLYEPESAEPGAPTPAFPLRHSAELLPDGAWTNHRFVRHPIYKYERRDGAILRTEENSWGIVTHVARLHETWMRDVHDVFTRESARARDRGVEYLMDCWAFDCPGPGWTLAPDDVPSVFHPPQARGNLIYAVGKPFLPVTVHKGDCDQDRPN